jgi:hypothetical protein
LSISVEKHDAIRQLLECIESRVLKRLIGVEKAKQNRTAEMRYKLLKNGVLVRSGRSLARSPADIECGAKIFLRGKCNHSVVSYVLSGKTLS